MLLADGTSRPIEKLTLGDRVLATDPVTGITAAKPVIDTIIGTGDKKLVDLTIDTDGDRGDKTATITATHNHPFWVPALSEWVHAEHLSPQQWLRTSAGTHVQISATRNHTATTRVHNLTIADIHTYYVMVGNAPILVHNSDCEIVWKNKYDARFPNRHPDPTKQDPLPDPSLLRRSKDGRGKLKDGEHHFVIMTNDEVRSVYNDDLEDLWRRNIWPGHTSLAGRDGQDQPIGVLMAGTFHIKDGKVTRYRNDSGHYKPQEYGDEMLQKISERAFTAAGYDGRRWRFIPW